MTGLDVRIGVGVAFGSDSKPGSATVLVTGLFTDLKAKKEIKIPAPNAVMSKTKYSDTFFILLLILTKIGREFHMLCKTLIF